jgi:hypothetical protein
MINVYYKVSGTRYVGGCVGSVTTLGSSAYYKVPLARYVGGCAGWVAQESSALA